MENIEKHIQNLKDYIKIDKDNITYDDSDFAQFCKGHCEDIQAVLDELDKAYAEINRLKRDVAYHIQQPNNIQFFK